MQTWSRQRISTEGVPPAQRVAFWEARTVQTLVGLRCATFDGDVLAATQTRVRLDDVCMTDIAGNAHVIERTAACVREAPKRAVFVSLVLQSDAFFYHDGGCARVGPGDIIVYDTAKPYLFGFPGPMRQFLFDLPLSALDAAQVRAPASPLRLSHDSNAGRVHGGALRRLASQLLETPDAAALPVCREQIVAVVAGLLRADAGAQADVCGAPAATHWLAAEAYIARHLGSPDLEPEGIAAACGISPRHLGRLFAQQGVTVMHYVLERRLLAAQAALRAQPARPISQVAYRAGFASASHFARVFRARFDCTPREYRHAAKPAPDLP